MIVHLRWSRKVCFAIPDADCQIYVDDGGGALLTDIVIYTGPGPLWVWVGEVGDWTGDVLVLEEVDIPLHLPLVFVVGRKFIIPDRYKFTPALVLLCGDKADIIFGLLLTFIKNKCFLAVKYITIISWLSIKVFVVASLSKSIFVFNTKLSGSLFITFLY